MFGNGYFWKARGFHGCHESMKLDGGSKQSHHEKKNALQKMLVQVEQEDCENK